MDKWLWIIGVDPEGLSEGLSGESALTPHALAALHKADVILTSPRLAQLLASDIASCHHIRHWSRHMDKDIDHIKRYRDKRVVILASGDPLYYGVATLALRFIPITHMTIIPARSSISLACARMGWTQQHVTHISLHGRDPHHIIRHLSPKQRILILSEGITTLHFVAKTLCDYGMGNTTMTALSQLASPQESRMDIKAKDASQKTHLEPLTILAIECSAWEDTKHGTTSQPVASLTSLNDTPWRHDGMLTKQVLRTNALALLAPHPAQTLWDIGSGSGSIAIEWMRTHHLNHAVAIEQNPQRCHHIRHNALHLGTPTLSLIEGHAPDILSQLQPPDTPPDAIFIGGGLDEPNLIETCYHILRTGQRLVAHSVTLEHEHTLLTAYERYGGALQKIQTHTIRDIGSYHRWHALHPVTQWSLCKP